MGTAAVISLIRELKYKDIIMKFDPATFTIAARLKQQLNDLRQGKADDTHGWMFKV